MAKYLLISKTVFLILIIAIFNFSFASAENKSPDAEIKALEKQIEDLTLEAKKRKNFEEISKQTVVLIEKLIKLYPYGSKEYKSALKSLFSLKLMGLGDNPDDPARKTIVSSQIETAKKLTRDFPKDDEAFQMLAGALGTAATNRTERLEAIKAYAKCLNLNKSNKMCRDFYNHMVAEYKYPKCLKINSQLAFYVAKEKSTVGFTQVAPHQDKTLYLQSRPALEGWQIDGARLQDSQEYIDDQTITLELSPKGKEIIADVTEKNVGNILAVVLNNEVLSAPIINHKINSSDILLTLVEKNESKNLFKKVCQNIQKNELPKEAVVKN